MRVLVMGSGGVGGYYGGVLAQQGHDVTFVARGPHLAALRERGLELRRGGAVTRLQPVVAVASPSEAPGPFELVLFTVKTYDTEDAAAALRPAVGPDTAVLTLQNGVESAERLGRIFGADRVLAGTTILRSRLVAPGVVEESGAACRATLGELAGAVTPRVRAVAAALQEAGVDATVTTDIRLALWEKFAPLAAHASITSACQLPVGPIRDTAEGAALYRAMLAESFAVGRAAGVTLTPAFQDRILAHLLSTMPPDAETSMQWDYARQGRVELEQLTGTVVRLGHEHGVPTPHFDALYAVLKAQARAFGGLA
jgi:2-dehydropantoate 2-reductase